MRPPPPHHAQGRQGPYAMRHTEDAIGWRGLRRPDALDGRDDVSLLYRMHMVCWCGWVWVWTCKHVATTITLPRTTHRTGRVDSVHDHETYHMAWASTSRSLVLQVLSRFPNSIFQKRLSSDDASRKVTQDKTHESTLIRCSTRRAQTPVICHPNGMCPHRKIVSQRATRGPNNNVHNNNQPEENMCVERTGPESSAC